VYRLITVVRQLQYILVLYVYNPQLAKLCLPMDARVKAKLHDLVACGVRRLPEMRRHLRHFVISDLFAGQSPPDMTDARFWPSSRSLLNAVHQAMSSNR